MENHALLTMLLHWAVSALALMITAYCMPGFKVGNFISALLIAAVVGLANSFIWPILIFLTLPLNFLTLGLFTFVVNGAVLKICAAVTPNFEIKTWAAAIWGAIVLSVVGTVLHYFLI